MIRVQSAKLIEYNANDRGKHSPDCVKRAISMAFSLPYAEVSKLLRQEQEEYKQKFQRRAPAWNSSKIYPRVIKKLGGSSIIRVSGEHLTLSEFADKYSKGTYLVETGNKFAEDGSDTANHIVCVVDGEVFDSWNSLNEKAISYYTVEGEHKPKTDIKDRFPELIEYAKGLITDQVELRMKKFKIADLFDTIKTTYVVRGFAIQILQYYECTVFEEYNPSITVTYALTPTTTYDEAIEYINKITPQRVYDRLYVMRDKIKEYKEAAEYAKYDAEHPDDLSPTLSLDKNWFYPETERFFKSLPLWVKNRVTSINVFRPGHYSDSYELSFNPLPGDDDRTTVELWAETATEMKDRIAEYKKTYNRDHYEW